jgi:outer membrane lipoprotein SlyB
MAVVLGSFDTQTEAEGAMDRMKSLGLDEDDFSIISHADPVDPPPDDDQRANTQVDVAVAGGAAGAVLGGLLLGPIGAVVGGLLAGGGLAAALVPHGVTKEEAEAYERRLHQGRYVLAVRTPTDEIADSARRIMVESGAEEIEVDR